MEIIFFVRVNSLKWNEQMIRVEWEFLRANEINDELIVNTEYISVIMFVRSYFKKAILKKRIKYKMENKIRNDLIVKKTNLLKWI